MTDHHLAPAWLKARHAERHLQALHDEVSAYLGRSPFEVKGEIDRSSSTYTARLSIKEEMPSLLSLMAGDVVANLRAALDHAVCRLAEHNGAPVSTRHQFPILDQAPSKPRQETAFAENLRGLGDIELEIVRAVQPYEQSGDPGSGPLHNLRKLSNEDKHRVILARYAAIPPKDGIEIRVGECHDAEPVERVELFANRPLIDGSEILRAEVKITGPNPRVAIGGDLPFEAAFGASMVPLSGLAQIRDSVCAVLLALGDPKSALEEAGIA